MLKGHEGTILLHYLNGSMQGLCCQLYYASHPFHYRLLLLPMKLETAWFKSCAISLVNNQGGVRPLKYWFSAQWINNLIYLMDPCLMHLSSFADFFIVCHLLLDKMMDWHNEIFHHLLGNSTLLSIISWAVIVVWSEQLLHWKLMEMTLTTCSWSNRLVK